MAFWDDLQRNISGFFGGGNNQKKKKKEEEQRNRVTPVRSTGNIQLNQPQAQPRAQDPSKPLQLKKPVNIFEDLNKNLTLGKQTQSVLVPQKQLDTTADAKYKENLGKEEAQADLYTKIFDRKGMEERAKIASRNQAATDYQEKNGWNNNPEVKRFTADTVKRANVNAKSSQDTIKNTKTAVDVMRWVPGAGIGELGANVIRGNFSGSKEADDTLLREQMDLTPDQIAGLGKEDRDKMLLMAKGGLGAGVLDFVGVGAGSLVKGGGKKALKEITLRSLAKNLFSKQGAKTVGKNVGVGAGAGAVIGGGGTKMMGGTDEEAFQNTVSGAISGGFGGAAQSPLDVATALTKNTGKTTARTVANRLTDGEIVDNIDAAQKTATRVQVPIKQGAPVAGATGDNLDIPVTAETQQSNRGSSIDFNDNTPAFVRKQEAAAQDAATSAEVNAGVQDVIDIPAYQRQGKVLESERSGAARADDLREQLSVMPTVDRIRSSEFEIKSQFAKDVKAHPNLRQQLQAKLNENLDALKRSADESASLKKELDTLDGELSSSYQQRKMAQTLQAETISDIPAVDRTVVPTGLPETPGTVRVTTQTAPNNAKSAAAANQPALTSKKTLEIDELYDGGKSSKDGSDLYGTPTGEKLTVEMPSQKDVDSYRAKKVEYETKGSGYVSNKADIVVKDADGNELRRISFDEAVKRYGTTDPDKLAALVANRSVEAVSTVKAPAPIIPKVGEVLPDGTKVTKRMVQSARNQRKLARQMAKTQEDTAAAMERVQAAKGISLGENPSIIGSGQYRTGKKGVYETAKVVDQKAAGAAETSTMSGADIINRARENQRAAGNMTSQDIRDIESVLFDNPRYKPGDPEYIELSKLYGEAGTAWGQEGAFRGANVARRVGNGERISNQAISKLYALSEDPTKITDAHIASIQKTADNFASSRDAATKALDDFNGKPTPDNYQKYVQSRDAADKALKDMALAQFEAGKSALKGNANVKLRRLVEDSANDADVYTMDYIDASMLSGTGTFVRNFANAGFSSAEEGLFGGIGSRIGGKIAGTTTGGGLGHGSIKGFNLGMRDVAGAAKTRAKSAGFNPIEHMKNWSTAGNQLGDSWINANIYRSVLDDYTQQLKKAGFSGDELRMRADVLAREDMLDPKGIAQTVYGPRARNAAGLGSGISKSSTPEKWLQRKVSDSIASVSGKEYSQAGENIGKAVTRATIGFPSAVARSIGEGLQRVVPLFNADTVRAILTKDPATRGVAIKDSIKKSGSAAAVMSTFGALGASGAITGAYPEDKNERERWEREGIKENSIRVGDAWYDVPSYAGSFGVPMMISAAIGRHGGLNDQAIADIRSIAGSINPTDSLSDLNQAITGEKDFGKYTQSLAASAGRMATPFGSLLNQLSRVFDSTQNDTGGDTWVEGTLNKLIDGVPFLDEKMLPNKTDSAGNVLYQPKPLETMVGAAGAVQGAGEQRSQEIDSKINDSLSKIDQYGLLGDPNMEGVLEGAALEAFTKAKTGKQLDESDIKALKAGLVKGVSSEGTDTAYLERGQYDTNLAVLQLKRDLMQEDKTIKPSSLKDIDTAIKRGEVYRDNTVSYEDITNYKSIGVDEWRKMGIPPGDKNYDEDLYNPEMYQKLWDIDQLMTKNGVSYKKGALDKNKYFLKEKNTSRGGGGGGSSRQLDTSFGTLKAGTGAPSVKQYDSIDAKSGGVPVIRRVRPNIVHKVGKG